MFDELISNNTLKGIRVKNHLFKTGVGLFKILIHYINFENYFLLCPIITPHVLLL